MYEDYIETADCAIQMKNEGVCGIDIAGDESRYPLKDFREPVKKCKDAGINVTIHAGEAAGPEYIKEAIDMGADRIGHGVSLIKDRELIGEVARRQIPLEICLTSNIHTQVVADYESHPVMAFIENGVKVTLNTDDRGVSGIDLTYEFMKAYEIGIGLDRLKKITLDSVTVAFLTDDLKRELRDKVISENDEVTDV